MIYTFRTIAKYERKILMRSWFFRIFTGLALFIIFGFNMGDISEVGNMNWGYRAVPSNMPYASLFFLNIAQAIIAVFLSSEFVKRDRKQDTVEVIYARSMSNTTYVWGKVWSLLSIFLLVNLLVLIMALIFNLLAMDTYVDWRAYLYYPLLISLPTLLFIIGLSILLMSLIRNQALTFVLLLGYILSSLIYLKSSYSYLFDYMAFYLPLFHSDIAGFTDWDMIFRLRLMYACLGLGFIFFSVLLINRLPQSKLMSLLSLVFALGFVGYGTFLGYQHLKAYQAELDLPQQMIALNNQYVEYPRMDVEDHEITLKQSPYQFTATSTLRGKLDTTSETIVFNLNPGLEIQSVQSQGRPLSFDRQLQLLFVQLDSLTPSGTDLEIVMEYAGTIEEDACFIDVEPELKYKKPNDFIFDIGRRYAFVLPEFLLLTPEAHWYPQAGVSYSDESPFWYRKDFIHFQLQVETLPGLTPVAHGEPEKLADNTFQFQWAYALPQLSLSIGRYQKSSLQADGMEFSVYHTEGHDYFKTAFPDIRDTIPFIIRESLGDFERRSGLKYPFEAFVIVEVPGQFKTYDRSWTSAHETNQPGLVYMPEKGMHSRNLDFSGSVHRRSRWSRNRNLAPEELQMRVLNSFLSEFYRFKNVNTTSTGGGQRTVEETINPYYQFAQLYEMCNNLDSRQWPVLNRIFESYLRKENNQGADWVRRSSGSTQNELANMVLQEKSFAGILTLTENRELIDNVIELKGETLFSLMQVKAGTDRFRDYITDLLQQHRFTNFSFETFESELDKEFGIDLSTHMNQWFHETSLPRYLISAPIAEKVVAGNREMTRIQFKVANYGSAEGVIKPLILTEEPIEKLLYLEPGQTKEVHYLSLAEPSGIRFNTLTSGNLPNQIEYSFEQINETAIINAEEKETVIDNPFLSNNSREIIVDNESQGFEYTHFEEVSRLRKWLNTSEENDFKYKGTQVWRPPLNWTATTDDDLFGEFVRSAYYIKSGDGSKAATWKVPVTEPGRYEVYYHVYKDPSFNWDRSQRGNYQFDIPHENGIEQVAIELKRETPGGWTPLGDYEFAADTIMISLSNESRLRAIFADAVKLVRMD
jgi:ABC-type transport system involved in multi-copper enzyme maturation permease subunit